MSFLRFNSSVFARVLRPVRVASFICQVQDVTRHVVLCGEIGQHPRLFGSSDLQPTYWTVSILPAPAETEKQWREGGCNDWTWMTIVPFIDAFLTEAVGAGQDEVCFSIHADTALLLIGQLLHSAAENTFSSQSLKIIRTLQKRQTPESLKASKVCSLRTLCWSNWILSHTCELSLGEYHSWTHCWRYSFFFCLFGVLQRFCGLRNAGTCPSTCWPGRTLWRAAWRRPLQTAPQLPGWWCHGTVGWTGTGSWCATLPSFRSLCWSGGKESGHVIYFLHHGQMPRLARHACACGLTLVQRTLTATFHKAVASDPGCTSNSRCFCCPTASLAVLRQKNPAQWLIMRSSSDTQQDLHVIQFSHSCQKLLVVEVSAVSHQSDVFYQLLRQMVHHRLTWELLAHPGSSRAAAAAE